MHNHRRTTVAISGGDDRTVRVWDLDTGTERTTLTGHTGHIGWVMAVACTTIDGRPVAISGGDDGTVRVWDLHTGTERITLRGHTGWVRAVACTTIDGDCP